VTQKGSSCAFQVSTYSGRPDDEEKNIPDWFDNPKRLNKKFSEYIVPAKTSSSPNIKIAIEKAKDKIVYEIGGPI
jgi:hypothetical protein